MDTREIPQDSEGNDNPQTGSSALEEIEQDSILSWLKEKETEKGWSPDGAQGFGDMNSFKIWSWITWKMCPKQQLRKLVLILSNEGRPGECLTVTPNEWVEIFNSEDWPEQLEDMSSKEDNKVTLQRRVARAIVWRLKAVNQWLESKQTKGSNGRHQQTVRLNSYGDVPKLDEFNWAHSFGILHRWIRMKSVDKEDFVSVILRALRTDSQRKIVERMLTKTPASWEGLVREILPHLDPNFKKLEYYLALTNLKPKPGETMESYQDRFRDYLVVVEVEDGEKADIFCRNIPEEYRKQSIVYKETGAKWDLESLLAHLNRLALDPINKVYFPRSWDKITKPEGKKMKEPEDERRGQKRPLAHHMTPQNKRISNVPRLDNPNKNVEKIEGCFICGSASHWKVDCPKKQVLSALKNQKERPHSTKNQGHKRVHKPPEHSQGNANNKRPSIYLGSVSVQQDKEIELIPPILNSSIAQNSLEQELERRGANWLSKNSGQVKPPPIVPTIGHTRQVDVFLQGTVFKQALLDSGAQTSLISQETLEEIEKEKPNSVVTGQQAIEVQYANSAKETGKLAQLDIQWNDKCAVHTFIVVPKLTYPVIIGMDLLNKWPMFNPPAVTAQTLHRTLSKVKLADLDDTLNIEQQQVEFHPQKEDLMLTIKTALDENLCTEKIHSTIGEIEINFKNHEDRLRGIWKQQTSMSVTGLEKYQAQVQQWLGENVIEEIVDLPSWRENDEQAALQDFLSKNGIKEEFQRNGVFNINGFPIYSGKPRIVHNFKPLNDLILDDTCDVPGVNHSLDKIASKNPTIYSKMDLRSAYLQIPLRRQDRSVCAFTCDDKRYRFVTAPLGLKTIPSQFQRWLKSLLQQHNCLEFSTNHIDDVIIFSCSPQIHTEHVQRVLRALTSVCLTVNESKCIFFATKLPVLGFWLEVGGLRPNSSKLFSMMEWERPNTIKKVQSLLGILNFFRRFIPNATNVLLPIMRIKSKKFKWDEQPDAERAYREAYKLLVQNGPFLYFPVNGSVIELATDASQYAISAILFQDVEGVRHYLGFNSRVLKESEQKYSTVKKELISILYHVRYYRDHLIGQHFHLHTDAQALATVLKNLDHPKKNSILAGWLADLGEYDFDVFHIAGKDNVLPDLGSRVQTVNATPIVRNNNIEPQPVISNAWGEEEVKQLIEEVHSFGHWGSGNMYKHITQTLGYKNIPNLLKRCEEETKSCDPCLRVNKYRMAYAPPRQPELYLPMQYVHVDLLQPEMSSQGFAYVLVAIDQMSGYVWLRPLLSKNMNDVSEALLGIFTSFGFPEKLKSDQGGEFWNKLVTHMCNVAKVKHLSTVAYDHHSNGVVERAIRSARDTLAKMVRAIDQETFSKKWEELLPLVQFALNCKVNRITGTTPFALMFGRHPFPIPTTEESKGNIDRSREIVKGLWSSFHSTVPHAVMTMRKEEQTKAHYPHKTGHFKLGDFVYCLNKKDRKGEDSYDGPYRVKEVLGKGMYKLEFCENINVIRTEPTNHLKSAAPVDKIKKHVRSVSPATLSESKPITTSSETTFVKPKRRYFNSSLMPNKRKRNKVNYVELDSGVGGIHDKE